MMDKFGTDDQCREALVRLRWPSAVTCPECHSQKTSHVAARHIYDCDSCRYQFSVTAGTMLHDSRLPLRVWFYVTYLMTESKKGISANQIKRMFKINYKTAWYLCHRIRKAMEEANPPRLKGTVEVDETYIGGHRRHVGSGGGYNNKTMVLGAVERGGAIRLRVERKNKRADRAVLHAFVAAVTEPTTERLITDAHPGYHGLADADTTHETVDHAAEEWVRGDVHTNTVESVWSLFKRSIVGAFHQVSAKHLDNYLSEFEWRFNNRNNPYLFRDTLVKLLNSKNLEYKELTKAA